MNSLALACFKALHFYFLNIKTDIQTCVFVAFINNLITDSSLLGIKLNKGACQFAKSHARDLHSGGDR